MSVVVPCLLASTKEELIAQQARMPFAKRLHIDVMDGQFAPHEGIGLADITWPDGVQADIHLMHQDPTVSYQTLVALRPARVIIHAEAQGDLMTLVQALQKEGIAVGVALMRSTVPADFTELIGAADHVLVFSGNLGEYGGTANMLQIEKVRLIRAINPEVEIGWDGGANVSNAYTLSLGGIDVVNVGSALAKADDPAEVYRRLDFEVHRKDIAKEKKKV